MISNIKNKFAEIPVISHLFFVALAALFCFFYWKKIMVEADFDAANGLNAVASFTANKPFQFRLFLPLLSKIFFFIPAKTFLIAANFGFIYLALVTFYHLLKKYFAEKRICLFLAPAIIYPMFWNYIILNEMFQYYDMAAVFFFTLGLYLVAGGKYKVLLFIFILGVINKESMVYLIFAYLFFNYKTLFSKETIMRAGMLAAVFLIIKFSLSFIFKSNPGDAVEYCLPVNIDIVTNILSNRIYQKNLGLSFGALYLFVILLFVTGRWKKFTSINSPDLLAMNLVFIPYMLMGIFIVYFTEVRVYAELITPITILALIYLGSFTKWRFRVI